jgi:hypothetical protein
MSIFAQSLSQSFGQLFKPVAKGFCGTILAVWLFFATYGLDLSSGFF